MHRQANAEKAVVLTTQRQHANTHTKKEFSTVNVVTLFSLHFLLLKCDTVVTPPPITPPRPEAVLQLKTASTMVMLLQCRYDTTYRLRSIASKNMRMSESMCASHYLQRSLQMAPPSPATELSNTEMLRSAPANTDNTAIAPPPPVESPSWPVSVSRLTSFP